MVIANSLALLLYIVCSISLIRSFKQGLQQSTLPVGLLTVLALIFHASDIFFTMLHAGGWDLSLFSALTLTAWLMAFIAFIYGSKSRHAHPGMVVYPIVALCLALKLVLPSEHAIGLSDPALEWHVLLSLTAYSLFDLAAINAVILSIQEKQLRQHQLNGLLRQLPPLQTLETSLFQLIKSGFSFLTIGLITGFVFVDDFLTQHLAHKTVLSMIAWCVFAALLWGRWQYGWRARTAVKWTLIGFIFLVLAYFGSKLMLEYIIQTP
jgi:ABC-type uncharacterized transport system permease subunit